MRDFGAVGDGVAVDTGAVNRAIMMASDSGGGVVWLPAGTYLCYSIRLRSRVSLQLSPGATILGAGVAVGAGPERRYDEAEHNPWDAYQDYGHSHWHNSLMWGEDLHDISIAGSGLIWGRGLSRGASEQPLAEALGMGNKALALKNCRNILLRDFSILEGGHFAVLATGVDNLTIDNLLIDTNRDGIDVDCCRNVRISNCSVNSPWDDAICPKSSYALGAPRITENLTITQCYVTGAYQMGTMLDGTWKRWPADKSALPDVKPYFPDEFNGSIKLGTESNGGFRNVVVANCVFDGCKGLALESSDGAQVEDIVVSGITLRDCTNAPLFFRLGGRMRGPEGAAVGTMRGIVISDVVSHNSVSRLGGGGIFSGIPGHDIEDVKVHNVYLEHRGGGTAQQAALDPPEGAEDNPYPDPDQFGDIPACGFYVRHVKNIEFSNVEIAFRDPDLRPAVRMEHVEEADFFRFKTPRGRSGSVFLLRDVKDFRVASSRGVDDTHLESAMEKKL